ncbi:PD-(D/E)XK motif protein [Actinoallomurus sp. NPDC052308]|uniref:PD-(D/E)XK motif protein n=1 Tax=Actinoallomurus sp. NPDC052308 TaxID=3155530 RepID=UPI0034418A44
MRITETDWQDLETPQGTPGRSMRRIHPESPHDLHIAVTYPQRQRMLVLDTDERGYERAVIAFGRLPRTQGLELAFSRLSRQHYELRIALTSDSLKTVFTTLVVDIARAISQAPDGASAVTTAINQFERWQTLLQSVGEDGLNLAARRGLYGELLILRDYVIPELGPASGVMSWTGPSGTNQDFQLPSCAIEVKATTARASSELTIANERQLDGTGVAYLVLALVILDERRGGLGTSLNAMVESARQTLPQAAQADLDEHLAKVGYFSQHAANYEEPRYTLREIRFWSVHDDFPRITEPELRSGVSNCNYRIQTTGLDAYVLALDDVRNIIRGSHG